MEHPINGAPGSLCLSGKLFKSIELIFSNNLIFFPREGVHNSFTKFSIKGNVSDCISEWNSDGGILKDTEQV